MVACGRYALSSRMSSVDPEILSPRLFSMGEKLVPVGGAQVLNVCHDTLHVLMAFLELLSV